MKKKKEIKTKRTQKNDKKYLKINKHKFETSFIYTLRMILDLGKIPIMDLSSAFERDFDVIKRDLEILQEAGYVKIQKNIIINNIISLKIRCYIA